jgi:poly-gamma-glutamate capsule biosynthesis protein CapA/YwtB (metallophosphatase superfamily)
LRTRLLLLSSALLALVLAACSGNDAPANGGALVNPTASAEGAAAASASAAAASDTPTPTASPEPKADIPALTTADVFPPRDLSKYDLDASHIRTLIATGDVIPARHTDYIIRQMGNDFGYTVRETKDITSAADVTVINLEAPLIEGCPEEAGETFTFCGQPGFTSALNEAGVDVATLENNHIGNYGSEAITETEGYLDAAGIKWSDRSNAAIIDVRGVKFGFLAFNGVGFPVDRVGMAEQITALRPQVDVLAVAFHWGMEYVGVPQPAPGIADDDPIEIAHAAIDAGADFIIGNHPHWIQGVEVYKGKWITYAHGNFIFDQEWSYETTVGVIGKYTFYDDTLIGVEFIPVHIMNYAQPVPMTGQERQDTLDIMKKDTEDLAALLTSRGY